MDPAAARRSRLVVVDDNRPFAENLAELLSDEGYSVRTAGSCAEARPLFEERVDLALVDLKLPDGDGTSLARELKGAAPDSEVILLTGFATLESAAEAVRAGACAYLLKPCGTPELLMTVQQAMRQVHLKAERRELTRRTQVAEKLAAVGTLTAGLSHEIRNPLNAAGLQLSVLERRIRKISVELQPPLLEPLILVKDEIRRLNHVLEDFLQFARPVQFTPKPVALAQAWQKVEALFAPEAERRGIRVEHGFDPEASPVLGDEERLRQVLVNLTLNALQATPEGGRVTVRSRLEGNDAVLEFDDTGSGIPPELLPRILEPFFTTKPSGSGLGLPIVHAILTQHGGSLRAENLSGGGARFTVRLPLARGWSQPVVDGD